MKTLISSVVLTLLSLSSIPVSAQFEGDISYKVYYPQQSETETLDVDMFITRERVLISSSSTMDVMAGLKTTGVLVRNDLQDFVLITEENEGIKVQKNELDNIVNLMNRMQGKDANAQRPVFRWDERVEETGNTREINGYETSEFVLKGDNENEYVSVWLTEQIKVNWGLLLDAWYDAGAGQFDQDIPIEIVMNNNSFPLLVEAYKNGSAVMRATATSVETGSIDRSKTELPSGMKLIGLSEIMMNMFMQNR